MKKSFVAFMRAAMSRKRCAFLSASSRGRDARALGRLGNRLAMLVGACQEEDVLAPLAVWRASTSTAIVVYA